MEIERKFLIPVLPEKLDTYPHRRIEQAYLCTEPVVRIRRQDDIYILTYKHLKGKADGIVLSKTRYLLPLPGGLTIELDVFDGTYEGLWLAEVEFESIEQAEAFVPPVWFGEDVTYSGKYHNSVLSRGV